MRVTITLARLQELDACGEAVAAFRDLYGERAEDDWTPEKQMEVLRGPLRKYFGWAYVNKLLPMWSLSAANLSGADLSGANLSGADLTAADLSGADLSKANLYRADLSGANLSAANLYRAYLYRANLYRANLSAANLYRADLSGADLSGAKVCLCNNGPCVRLREALDKAGWVPGADGLLSKREAEGD